MRRIAEFWRSLRHRPRSLKATITLFLAVASLAFALNLGHQRTDLMTEVCTYASTLAAVMDRASRTVRKIQTARPPYGWMSAVVIALASFLAGRRRHLRAAWLADLEEDAESGITLDTRKRRRLVRGFVVAALRIRCQDASDLVTPSIDWMLTTATRRHAVAALVTGGAAIYVQASSSFSAVIGNIVNFAAIYAGMNLALGVLRRWRGLPRDPARDDDWQP